MVRYKKKGTLAAPLTKETRKKTMKSASGKKKQKKGSSVSSIPADFHQPKEPDPSHSSRRLFYRFVTDPVTLDLLRQFTAEAKDEILQGNETFRELSDKFVQIWSMDFETFEDKIQTSTGPVSVDKAVETFLESLQEQSYDSIFDWSLAILDPERATKDDPEPIWMSRELLFRIAQVDPATFFKLAASRNAANDYETHWDFENSDNPVLRTDFSTTTVWLVAACILGHPWRANYHYLHDGDAPRELDPKTPTPTKGRNTKDSQRSPVEKQQDVMQNWLMSATKPTSVKNKNKNKNTKKNKRKEKGINDDESEGGRESNRTLIRDLESEGLWSPSKVDASVTKTPKQSPQRKKTKNAATPPRQDKMATDDDDSRNGKDELVDSDDDIEILKVERKPRATPAQDKYDSDSEHDLVSVESDEDDLPELRSKKEMDELEDDDDDEDDAMEATDDESGDGSDGSDAAEKSGSDMDEDLGSNATSPSYAEKAKTPPKTIRLTKEQKIQKLTQVDINGLSCKVSFFDISLQTNYGGTQAGKSIGDVWLKLFLKTFSSIFKDNKCGFRLLPFSDKTYKNKSLWITNEKELRAKIRSLRDLQLYIDTDYGNASWSLSNNKAGDKQLRSRARTGFDKEHEANGVMQFLHECFRDMGNRAGCFASEFQFGEQVRVGFICFLPPEVNSREYLRELLRRFRHRVSLGMKLEWVQMPFDNRTKWNDRQPGIRLWHVYCRREDSQRVDAELRQWLHPLTAKKDYPWAAVVHYVSDWKATEQGKTSISVSGSAKDKFLTMVSKARDFQTLTTTLYSEAVYPGMLKKASTRHFGDCSLLKILLAIKATPAQAAIAEDEDAEEDSTAAVTTEDGFTTVTKKKSKSQELQEALKEMTKDLTAAQAKALREAEVKKLRDAGNNVPCPLILQALPADMSGTFIFVMRLKFEPLGGRVVEGIVPFLRHHLGETSDAAAYKIISKWISAECIHRAQRRNLSWCTETAQARDLTTSNEGGLDDGLDFLEFGRDILDAFQGELSIDMEMADAKDIDDGATVAGALDDLEDTKELLKETETALSEAEKKNADMAMKLAMMEQRLHESSPRPMVHQRDQAFNKQQALRDEVFELRAELDRLRQQSETPPANLVVPKLLPTLPGVPPPQHTVPEPQLEVAEHNKRQYEGLLQASADRRSEEAQTEAIRAQENAKRQAAHQANEYLQSEAQRLHQQQLQQQATLQQQQHHQQQLQPPPPSPQLQHLQPQLPLTLQQQQPTEDQPTEMEILRRQENEVQRQHEAQLLEAQRQREAQQQQALQSQAEALQQAEINRLIEAQRQLEQQQQAAAQALIEAQQRAEQQRQHEATRQAALQQQRDPVRTEVTHPSGSPPPRATTQQADAPPPATDQQPSQLPPRESQAHQTRRALENRRLVELNRQVEAAKSQADTLRQNQLQRLQEAQQLSITTARLATPESSLTNGSTNNTDEQSIQSPPTRQSQSPNGVTTPTGARVQFAHYPPSPSVTPVPTQVPKARHSGTVTPGSDKVNRRRAAGDPHKRKAAQATRVVFQNVNGLPESPTGSKQLKIQKWLLERQVGIVLFAETNRHWSSLPEDKGWRERVRRASTSGYYAVTAHNTQQNRHLAPSSLQYGGCAAALLNETAHAAKEYGRDPSGLGRWTFIRIQGKVVNGQAKDLVVVSAYRPNKPNPGSSTVNAQHAQYFRSKGKKRNPRQAFITDLRKSIQPWRNEGCEVIVGVDANEDVSIHHPTSFRYQMLAMGLEERILKLHPRPRATFQRNRNEVPIDGLFATAGVVALAGGYYGFDEFFPSDHRGLWLDIDLKKTLGGHQPSRRSRQVRHLSSQDPRSVKKYLKSVTAGYLKYDIPNRLQKLATAAEGNNNLFNDKLLRQFNCLHKQAYDIRRQAEQNCRKLAMGAVPWSPQIQAFWDRIALWKILLKSRKKCRVSSRKVRRLMKKTGNPSAWKLPSEELIHRLRSDRRAYRSAKRNKADQWRKQHIGHQLRTAKKFRWRSKKARERFQRLRRMRQREEVRRRRRARGKGATGGLKAIQFADPSSGELITISEQTQVEQGCREENTARYDQTRSPFSTPPMEEPLYSLLNGPEAEDNSLDIMRGAFPFPPELDHPTTAFLSQCRFHSDFQPQQLEISTSEHIRFWQRMDESKGSEPHGLHNGHFKAGAQSPLIGFCDALFRHLPLVGGFVPEQWRHLMNFAIEKKPGDFRLSKMRTIQMMNSEFNATNKFVGNRAMRFAEKHNLIPPGQCGSRKNHQSIDLALSKRLVWDQLILQRRSAGWISNDAKSCFDRVVHSVAMLALLRFGITWATLQMMFNTLSTATHRVRTGYGDSDIAFSPPSDKSFQGCGQGNGAGPPIWVSISSVLILMMESAGYGFECLAAVSFTLVTAQCFSFIDDTDAIEAAKSVLQSGEDIFPQIQQAAKLWSGGIRATGGAINPEKSFWYFLDFEFDPSQGKWKFRNFPESPHFELKIFGLDGKLQPCERKAPNHSERTLGVMLAPLEDHKAQREFVTTKAKEWAETVRSGSLKRYDVLPLIRTTILKTLEYPSALTHLSAAEWDKIMSPILQVCLPKAGICRTFPRRRVFAPLQFQGLDLPHPFATQTFRQLDMLLRHPANRTQTSQYLSAVLQSHQLETGTSFGIFQQDYSNTGILASDTWIKRCWKQLEELDIYVDCDTPIPATRCTGDSLLMEVFMDAEVDQDELLWLNWCRMHLQVVTVSDLLTANGRELRRSAWCGIRDDHGQDVYSWPRTTKPAPRHWETWRRVLSETLLQPSSLRLMEPLGLWHDESARWRWVYSPSLQLLFHRQGAVWIPHRRSSTRSTTRRFHRLPQHHLDPRLNRFGWWALPLPSDIQRASITLTPSSSIHLTGLGNGFPPPSEPPPPSLLRRWKELAATITPHLGWAPSEIIIDGSEARLARRLLHNELRVVSDGSYKHPLGTAVTILQAKDGADRIVVFSQTPGLVQDQSAYRSELIGILAGVMVSDWLRLEWFPYLHHHAFRVEVACDGLSALRNSFGPKQLKATQRQFDLLSAIRGAIADCPIRWNYRHVDGHRDKTVPWANLTWWEQRNVEADQMAGIFRRFLRRHRVSEAPNARFFSEPSALFIQGVKQSRLDLEHIRLLVSRPNFKDKWQVTMEDEVDWVAIRRSMRSLRPGLQRWIVKHSFGQCGVGKWLKRWDKTACDKCPLGCQREPDEVVETALHVPRCTSAAATAAWENQIELLDQWLGSNLTIPAVHRLLLALIHEVRQPDSFDMATVPAHLLPAIRSQRRIGAQGLLEGRLSRHWAPLQADYFHRIGSQRSPSLWASRLSQQLILIGHEMWTNRNSICHSEDGVQNQRLSLQVNNRILRQFRMGAQDLPPSVRPMLRVPVRTVLERPLHARQEWANYIADERRDYSRALNAQRHILRSFFN